MILVDTSLWVDHLRAGDDGLERLLERGHVLGHPWVLGELSLGHLSRRREVLGLLAGLPQAVVATEPEVSSLIERHELQCRGVGYVDVQLLASTRLTPDAALWTRDRRLLLVAEELGVAARTPG